LSEQPDISELVEVVMDLGRPPEARFFNREIVIIPQEVSDLDLGYVVSRVSRFGEDTGRESNVLYTVFQLSETARAMSSSNLPCGTRSLRHH